jgi:hypothetical protein
MREIKKGISIIDDSLVLNIRYPYYIELSRIDTPIKVYQWVIHLLEKEWVSRELLFDMVDILERHFGYDLHRQTD